MLFLPKTDASHEDLFVERYDRLFTWALQLTDRDHSLAEDLLHDAFILFTVNQPDLGSIKNLDAYLHTVLRNLHISQMRSPTRSRFQQLSILDYDSAEIGLCTVDPRDQIQAQDQLRRVCFYACARKETAKLGSILILRFFHGYYPGEIVAMLRTTRNSVDHGLLFARAEAKANLNDPGSVAFIRKSEVSEVFRTDFARTTEGFLSELRQMIFRSRKDQCLSRDQLERLYQTKRETPLSRELLAHIVSCAWCLDEVNRLLGLPLLSERYPTDTINKDTSGKGGGPTGGTPTGRSPRRTVTRWKREAKATFEHKPQELCIAVNGYIQGSQKISSELMEQSFIIDTPEKIGFVEVFSEQGFRLLLLNIDEPPPVGPGEHSIKVELSDQRTLELSLRFTNPWPTIYVTYSDPGLKTEGVGESGIEPQTECDTKDPARPLQEGRRFNSIISNTWRAFADRHFWLKPGAVTAICGFLLLAVALFTYLKRSPSPPVSASELLARSIVAEEALAARTDQIVHRTLSLEERRGEGGDLIRKQKVEIWQSAERGNARRLYDERGKLSAVHLRRPDGTQTLYHHGAQPKLESAPQERPQATLDFDNVWQLSPSAKEFAALVGSPHDARVEETSTTYVISYEATGPALLRVSLILNHADLHPTAQSLVVRQDGEIREYRFAEIGFERKASNEVTPAIFEPDPELLSSAKTETPNSKSETAPGSGPSTPTTASTELEVEVLQRLNQAGALLGEQVSLTRTPEGLLRIEGIVESDQRKREIIDALGPIAREPAVRVELLTVTEAVARQKPSSSGSITVQQLEASKTTITVDSELRKYLAGSRGLSSAQLDQEVRTFSDRIINRSRQARRHALALKQITERFSTEELRTLDPSARARWRALVSEHARACQQEIVILIRELQPVFAAGEVSDEPAAMEIAGDEDFARAARRLFELTAANDDAVRTAFSVSDENASALRIRSPQFWRSLRSIESLAAKINLVNRRTP